MTNPPAKGDGVPAEEPAPTAGGDNGLTVPPAEQFEAAMEDEAAEQAVAVEETAAVTRRKPWILRAAIYLTTANQVMVTVYSLILAAVVGAILIIVSDPYVRSTWGYFFSQPGDALSASWDAVATAYGALFRGAVVDPDKLNRWFYGMADLDAVLRPIATTFNYSAPLIFTGMAVALAFRSGLFNIGAQGQAVVGAIGAAIVGFSFTGLPTIVHLPLTLLGGLVGGAIWGAIPGVLKALTGAHEVIISIMLNYIGGYLLLWVISTKFVHSPDRTDAISKPASESALFPSLFGAGLPANWGIVLAVVVAAGMSWFLARSSLGFRFRTVGANPAAAKTAGMGVAGTYATAMAFGGGLAGLGGATILLGSTSHALTPSVAGTIGFDGITVALLGRAKPLGVVFSALLFGAMQAGASTMQTVAQIPVDMVTVLQAVIVIFIAAPALVKGIFHLREAKVSGQELSMAKGW
ncbi:hypothetical protein Afil01_58150 [Actinorhabdospora filicis]|uniref:Nucleoside ABC transporter membrane protein n=2 Tax=Actinorhabdospora filicis TaxID=1785913 RepID=A0A9W6WCE7_9ACTN|nr:ABC transporter permease [Actinorhabdospora filicis]GLZ81008.1 hypothetical protein Afil01_58150 [Actinorhabdospora filicis]